MQFRLLYATVAALLFSTPVQSAEDESCEYFARKLGQPLDGWRFSYETGSPQCIRQAVDLGCPGQQYYNPDTRIPECCEKSGSLTWADKDAKLGYCCAANHEWTGDLSTGEGGCCPSGMRMVEGRCQDTPIVEEKVEAMGHSCGCHAKAVSSVSEPEAPPLPAIPVDLSIEYGLCYRLTFPDGREIGSNRENFVYTPGGLFQQIPFRVCKTTSDCALNGTVPYRGKFYLEDQIGFFSDSEGKMGWVAAHDKGATRMKFTWDTYQAKEFEGAMTCAQSDCPVRLSDVPQELTFAEMPCETDRSGSGHAAVHVQKGNSEL